MPEIQPLPQWKAAFDSLAPHGSLTPSGHVIRFAESCPKRLQAFGAFLIWLVGGQFPNGRILDADDQDMLEDPVAARR